jgi:hypothetical protein
MANIKIDDPSIYAETVNLTDRVPLSQGDGLPKSASLQQIVDLGGGGGTMALLGIFFGTAAEIAAIPTGDKYATEALWIAAGRLVDTYWLFFEMQAAGGGGGTVLFTDSFNNSTLDTANFTSNTAASGTVVEGASGLAIDSPAAEDASFITYKTAMPLANRKYTIRLAIQTTAEGWAITTVKNATEPAPMNTGDLGPLTRLDMVGNLTGVLLGYINDADAQIWSISTIGTESFALDDEIDITIETTATQFRYTYSLADGYATPIAQSAWIDWSSVKSNPATDGVNHWLTIGDIALNGGAQSHRVKLFKVESF